MYIFRQNSITVNFLPYILLRSSNIIPAKLQDVTTSLFKGPCTTAQKHQSKNKVDIMQAKQKSITEKHGKDGTVRTDICLRTLWPLLTNHHLQMFQTAHADMMSASELITWFRPLVDNEGSDHAAITDNPCP